MSEFGRRDRLQVVHRPYCCTNEAACIEQSNINVTFDRNGFCMECGIDDNVEERILSVEENSMRDIISTLVRNIQTGVYLSLLSILLSK